MRGCLERIFLLVERVVTTFLYPWCLLRARLGGPARVPILMYHQVGRPLHPSMSRADCVSPREFEVQMRALRRSGYRVLPLSSVVRLLEAPGSKDLRRCAALTFDDGLRDQVAHARPVLRVHGFPATFFLVAGHAGQDAPLACHLFEGAAAGDRRGFPAGWLPLSWEQARRLAADGMEIGSHSISHRSLGGLGDGEIGLEVRRSKAILEERLGVRVDLFAYPFGSGAYGDCDGRAQAMLRAAGYRAAVTTAVGRNARGADRLALRRIPMEEGDGPFRLRCKLAGAYDWVGPLKDLWQRCVPRRERVGEMHPAGAGGGGEAAA